MEESTTDVPDTPLGRMYRAHMRHIAEKDIDALLDQYTDDALIISSFEKRPLYYRGREGVRQHMEGVLSIEKMQSEVAFWAETDNPETLMIVEAITTWGEAGESTMRFSDSWVLRDDRIAIHFAGMTQYPDGSVA